MLTVVGMDVWSVKSFLPVRYANIMEEKFSDLFAERRSGGSGRGRAAGACHVRKKNSFIIY